MTTQGKSSNASRLSATLRIPASLVRTVHLARRLGLGFVGHYTLLSLLLVVSYGIRVPATGGRLPRTELDLAAFIFILVFIYWSMITLNYVGSRQFVLARISSAYGRRQLTSDALHIEELIVETHPSFAAQQREMEKVNLIEEATDLHFNAALLLVVLPTYVGLIIAFGLSYQSLCVLFPGAVAYAASGQTLTAFHEYLYFSSVAFATVGFGDIVPQTPVARVWVIVEILAAVFVTLIAISTVVNARTHLRLLLAYYFERTLAQRALTPMAVQKEIQVTVARCEAVKRVRHTAECLRLQDQLVSLHSAERRAESAVSAAPPVTGANPTKSGTVKDRQGA